MFGLPAVDLGQPCDQHFTLAHMFFSPKSVTVDTFSSFKLPFLGTYYEDFSEL